MQSNSSSLVGALVLINVEGRDVPFSLDWENKKWRSSETQKESDFPLATMVEGKRFLLYSDGTLAEAEK